MIVMSDRSRRVTSPLLDLTPAERDRIARAVHRAVATMRPPGGGGYHCCGYAAAGAAILLSRGFEVARQFGSFQLVPDPDDPTYAFTYDASSRGAPERGEFHAWLASREGVFIDFSAKDWPAMATDTTHRMTPEESRQFPASAKWGVTDIHKAVVEWKQPRLDYLWSAWNEVPYYVRYRADPEVITWGQANSMPRATLDELARLTIRLYELDPAVFLAWPGHD
jgi:hypothetical protein